MTVPLCVCIRSSGTAPRALRRRNIAVLLGDNVGPFFSLRRSSVHSSFDGSTMPVRFGFVTVGFF